MDLKVDKTTEDIFAFSSSIAGDVWHPGKPDQASELWYFDALSDDGNEAIAISFVDNYIYSRRNTKKIKTNGNGAGEGSRVPAFGFTYSKDGKLVYKAITEFESSAFEAGSNEPFVKAGSNILTYRSASYGSGYQIQIDAPLSGGRRLRGNFEWLLIESDFADGGQCGASASYCWNMVAPRCDVTGKVSVSDRSDADIDLFQFRGTGYHDHKLDDRWMMKTVHDWHWGRAHFADTTAVFYRYREVGDDRSKTKIILIRNGRMSLHDVQFEEQNYVRNKFGLKYPSRLRLISEDNIRMTAKSVGTIDTSFYGTRFLSDMTLTLPNGDVHETKGITEFVMPRGIKHRLRNWLKDLRKDRNSSGSRF